MQKVISIYIIYIFAYTGQKGGTNGIYVIHGCN